MAPEFVVMAEDFVDDGLTLLLARGGGVPRLGIYNTMLDKKNIFICHGQSQQTVRFMLSQAESAVRIIPWKLSNLQ